MLAENLAFTAQRSRLIVVGVQASAVKIYVTAVEELRKERLKLSLPPKLLDRLV
jgi:hypothetical protein